MAAVLRSQKVDAKLNIPGLESVLSHLITDQVVYFPIRHHSPACAWHLDLLIREWQPKSILIEGPAGFTPLIPLILHSRTKAPFAVYTSFVSKLPGTTVQESPLPGDSRRAAYYPFCDYSPELVALRLGNESGASLRFIDLDYPAQVMAEQAVPIQDGSKVDSLLAERHYTRSRYLQELARRSGCRDHNDLWDHLFETRLNTCKKSLRAEIEQFIHDVAAWCFFARNDAVSAELAADGTHAREKAMGREIKAELGKGKRVLVVTGGFHTVALPGIVASNNFSESLEAQQTSGDSITCLVRYSFEQLDALNGYSSGMPSPYYYNHIWELAKSERAQNPFELAALSTLVELGRLTRKKKLAASLSLADEIAALQQSCHLASMRGHPGPTREDLLDGIRSCFVKGAMDAEGSIVLGIALHHLGGVAIGEVPPEAGAPPLVENFRNLAGALRLSITDSVRRKTSLDLYRKTAHRRCSRFLHSLSFLDAPFATLEAGPDFVKGTSLERLHEHWSYQWTPQTESHLVEASLYGATVEEAAANRLVEVVGQLEQQGRARSARESVTLLIHACRMGLHQHASRLVSLIAAQVTEDPAIESLAGALNQLILLWESREPLEAHRLPEIPALIGAAYGRSCYLLHNLAATPPDASDPVLQAMITMRELLGTRAAVNGLLDSTLFWDALSSSLPQPQCPPLLSGGVAGMLHSEGRLSESDLIQRLSGALHAASGNAADQTGFLIGLLRTCRELAWRQPALVEAVESLLANWTEDEFIERLPNLRLAFSDLTPRETDLVAESVARMHGGEKTGRLFHADMSEAEMLLALRMNQRVVNALREDGLADWLEGKP